MSFIELLLVLNYSTTNILNYFLTVYQRILTLYARILIEYQITLKHYAYNLNVNEYTLTHNNNTISANDCYKAGKECVKKQYCEVKKLNIGINAYKVKRKESKERINANKEQFIGTNLFQNTISLHLNKTGFILLECGVYHTHTKYAVND